MQSPWWSDGNADPWRDPNAPAAVVVQPVVPESGPKPEPVADPDRGTKRGLGLFVLLTLITGLLSSVIGGALGYTLGNRMNSGGQMLGGGSVGEPPAGAQRAPDSMAGVAEQVLPSVVTVRVAGGSAFSVGSGFVVTGDGYVLTNDHVLAGAEDSISVTFADGAAATAELVGKDPESDLAVIKVTDAQRLTPVRFGDSDAIAVGDPVLAVGAPLALANTVTSGIVSALDRTIEAGEPGGLVRYYAAIQTDAAVNQGNSGGPLVDSGGRVIGVNSVIKSLAADEETAGNIGLAFAIPINQAKRIAEEIIATGKARRTVFGAVLEGAPIPSGGVRLSAVDANGPAEAAGLREGDIVTKFDGRVLAERTDLIALIRKYAPGEVVPVEYRRGSAQRTTTVTLAADAK